MSKYLIEHKIRTLSELWDVFEHGGFKFSSWDLAVAGRGAERGWLASKELRAPNASSAYEIFTKELGDIIERIGFIGQCSTTISVQPFLIYKQDNNPKKVFYHFRSHETAPVPLPFGDREKEALEILKDFAKQDVFKFLNESTKTETYYTRLAMLVVALESIVGDKDAVDICAQCGMQRRYKTTDKEAIREMLSDRSLYSTIFNYKTGVRNKIFHGKSIAGSGVNTELVYKQIVKYFNDQYGVSISTEVIGPQRTFGGNYLSYQGFFQPRTIDQAINLRDIMAIPENDFNERFDLIPSES